MLVPQSVRPLPRVPLNQGDPPCLSSSASRRSCGCRDAVLRWPVFGLEAGSERDQVDGARLGGGGEETPISRETEAGGPGASQVERALQGELAEGLDGTGLGQFQGGIVGAGVNEIANGRRAGRVIDR